MKFDGTDVIRTKMYYKDHTYRVDGVDVNHRVFVDWAESYCEEYVILGPPFQLTTPFEGQGRKLDIPILFTQELVFTSTPQDSHPAPVLTPFGAGPLHIRLGINV